MSAKPSKALTERRSSSRRKRRRESSEQARQDVQRFLKELGTDYIDIVLMHCLVDGNWATTMRPVMEALSEAKERGFIRAVGVSCHSFAALKVASEHPWG